MNTKTCNALLNHLATLEETRADLMTRRDALLTEAANLLFEADEIVDEMADITTDLTAEGDNALTPGEVDKHMHTIVSERGRSAAAKA